MQTTTSINHKNIFFMNHLFSDEIKDNQFHDVSNIVIDELLGLYPKKERIIKNCKYSNGKLIAELVAKDISYSTANPDYYTAEQLILAVSQMGYLLCGLSIQDEKYIHLECHLYEHFLSKIVNLECYYTELNFKFKKKILKRNDNIIEMNISKASYYPTRNKLFGNLSAKVGDSFIAETQLITI